MSDPDQPRRPADDPRWTRNADEPAPGSQEGAGAAPTPADAATRVGAGAVTLGSLGQPRWGAPAPASAPETTPAPPPVAEPPAPSDPLDREPEPPFAEAPATTIPPAASFGTEAAPSLAAPAAGDRLAAPDQAPEPPPGRLGRLPSPYEPEPRRRGLPGRRGLLIGAGVALALGAVAALLFRPGLEESDRRPAPAPAADDPAGDQAASAFRAAREAYRPPDREAVRRAYAQAATVYRAEGASGLARFGQECFRSLATGATYAELDFCLAFDAYGAAITQRLSGGQPAAPDSYFGQTEARHVRVAEAVMGGEGDASARLIDIRRLAIEVAREAGPAVTRARAPVQPQTPEPARPAPAAERTLERTPEPAVPSSAPPRQRAASPPPPPRLDPVESQALARPDPAPDLPSAEEVAASRPAGRGPSFNCRGARSTSERMVCRDPALAALDRRLNAAYEDAIAAGASRRELRAEQDRWLNTREAAAPDPDAVAQVYRRRIRELNAMR